MQLLMYIEVGIYIRIRGCILLLKRIIGKKITKKTTSFR